MDVDGVPGRQENLPAGQVEDLPAGQPTLYGESSRVRLRTAELAMESADVAQGGPAVKRPNSPT